MEEAYNMKFSKTPKHPYTRKLLGSVPPLQIWIDPTLHSIEGTSPDLYAPPKGCPFFDRCDEAIVICEEYMPEREYHTDTHYSCCWLNHPMAKSVAEGSV